MGSRENEASKHTFHSVLTMLLFESNMTHSGKNNVVYFFFTEFYCYQVSGPPLLSSPVSVSVIENTEIYGHLCVLQVRNEQPRGGIYII